MTTQSDLKKLIRARKARTGESYSTARSHILKEQAAHVAPAPTVPTRCEAIVQKVNRQSARIQILGETQQLTFRSSDIDAIIPGHVASLVIEKQWTWRGDAYATGTIESARIDIAKLGLVPLALSGGELENIREHSEACSGSDPYSRLWRRVTAKPRPSYEFESLAWGEFPGADPEDNPTCDAAELREMGRDDEARELLMDTLARDLRVLDAHAGLGNMEFDRSPKRALLHYDVGLRIGELSLPPGFDGLLTWPQLYNRAFLRCLHGYGLCLWRLSDYAGAQKVFERIISLNPNDHQGARFCWNDVQRRRSWEDATAQE